MKAFFAGLMLGIAALGTAVAAPTPPDQVVKAAVTRVQDLIAKNHKQYKADSASFYKMVDTEIVPHFDMRYITQLVLGKAWKDASEEQRTQFAAAFKNMLIRSYANAMLEYKDSVKAEWKPLRAAANATEVAVNSSLLRDGKPPVTVDFRMRLGKDATEWKVYDITVEGISLVTNFRGQISAEVKKSGIDAVIARMNSGAFVADTEKVKDAAQ